MNKMKLTTGQSVNTCYLSFASPASFKYCSSSPSNSGPHRTSRTTILKPSISKFCTSDQETFKRPSSLPPTNTISFGNLKSPNSCDHQHHEELSFSTKTKVTVLPLNFSTGCPSYFEEPDQYAATGYQLPVKRTGTRTPSQAQEHLLAERKRRDKISQRFACLSALVPGLKKLDKSSVIEGTIKHLKELQERLKALEEGRNREHGQESVVYQKKPCIRFHQEASLSSFDQSLTNLEVRILKGNVLVKACCRRRSGFTDAFLHAMEKLDLVIESCSFMPFADNLLAISAAAKMNDGFSMTEENLANNIRLAIVKLIHPK
ncbi:transcription factor bHLH19-like [Coffea eugenioides]|uniref:transcription factor bHLH19-like n=1 Tax=Coffea eugenioides TaxID=49369 RepID=UPI000F607BED|nr:transcription factor bHLH19-like [Coffea eugenioides]